MIVLRAALEATRDRHFPKPLAGNCNHCRRSWPCADYSMAVEQLAALDNAEHEYLIRYSAEPEKGGDWWASVLDDPGVVSNPDTQTEDAP